MNIMFQHPLYPLIFAVILAGIVVKQCIVRKKLLKNRLAISFVLIFVLALLAVFYKDISKNELWFNILNYSLIAVDVLIGIFFFFSVDFSLAKEHFHEQIIEQIDDKNYYLLLDKKNRIKDISIKLAAKFGYDKDELIGKKITDNILNDINIISINNEQASNERLLRMINNKDKDDLDLHIVYLNNDKTKSEIDLHLNNVYNLEHYSGKMFIGDLSLNKVNVELKDDSSLNDDRFSSILKNVQEGIFFINLDDKSVWCNDFMVKSLGLMGNSLSLIDYYSMFNIDDYNAYQQKIMNLTPENPDLNIIYRIKKDNKYIFVKENSTVIFDGLKAMEICGTLSVSFNRNFMKTNSSLVDNLKEEDELVIYLDELIKENKVFELVYLRLNNIPEINKEHSRSVGSMVIEEYVKTLQGVFVDNNSFFRITGLDFAFVITDIRKMENFRKIVMSKNILTPTLSYGAVSLNLDAYMGISFSNEAKSAKDIYLNAKNSLYKAIDIKQHYLFYHDYDNF